jgi:hypothetical protein
MCSLLQSDLTLFRIDFAELHDSNDAITRNASSSNGIGDSAVQMVSISLAHAKIPDDLISAKWVFVSRFVTGRLTSVGHLPVAD